VNGKAQVYFGGGDGILYAFDTIPSKEGDTDYIKKVWWFDAVPEEYKKDKAGKPIKYPAAEGPSEINATPVFYKNRVYVAIGQDPEHGEGVGRLVCVDATKTGDITKTGLIWDFKEIHRSISTVSIDPNTGLLFIADFSGFVYCLDAETGRNTGSTTCRRTCGDQPLWWTGNYMSATRTAMWSCSQPTRQRRF
jgi:hypothetical protein